MNETTLVGATLALIVYTLFLSTLTPVLSSLQPKTTAPNTETVETIGVGVYWDYKCASPIDSIAWGTLDPGSSKSITCYIRNEGTSPSTLDLYKSNWNPSNAQESITLSWDYDEEPIDPDQVAQVTFTLSVSASIEGITTFRFDVSIVGILDENTIEYAYLRIDSNNPVAPSVPFKVDGLSVNSIDGNEYLDGLWNVYTVTAGAHSIEWPAFWTNPTNQITYQFQRWGDGVTDNPRTMSFEVGETYTLEAVLAPG